MAACIRAVNGSPVQRCAGVVGGFPPPREQFGQAIFRSRATEDDLRR